MRNLPIDVSEKEIQPWHRLGGIEHICELHKGCMVLYGIFTELARAVYHDKDGRLIGTPDVLWSAKGRGVWIDSELRWEDQHPEVRPAIYVQLSHIKYEPYFHGINAKVLSANRFGETSYEQKASGTVTFMHVASTSGEACALADNTEYALRSMQDPICQDFCFTQFYSLGRLPLEKLPKEASDKFASGVVFGYEFVSAWKVTQESPILKAIDLLEYEDEKIIDYGSILSSKDTRRNTINHDNIVTEGKNSGSSRSK